MNTENSITQGPIVRSLVRLAMPIMGTAFIQTAYSMTNMLWLGHASSNDVAAVGTAGFYVWFSMALIIISKVGTEVGVAQAIGRKDLTGAKKIAANALQLNILLALIYTAIMIVFSRPLIDFFRLGDAKVTHDAIQYLVIVSGGLVFSFVNPVITAMYNGAGKSRTPFFINSLGLLINMVLDPFLIYGIGPFPELGVTGAAIATVLAQVAVTLVFIWRIRVYKEPIPELKLMIAPQKDILNQIVKIGLPVAIQSGMFTLFAMLIARMIASWGPLPIAVQKVGSQIEAISWMTANGFSTALSTFVGQNYGAGQWRRIVKGYFASLGIMSIVGVFATVLLVFGGGWLFSLFIPEKEAIAYGIDYLKILGYSQLFMCLEITTGGAFNGLGKTIPPSVSSILLTGLRVPAALVLSSPAILGLNGIWWSISISSILKGIVLLSWFAFYMTRLKEVREAFKTREA